MVKIRKLVGKLFSGVYNVDIRYADHGEIRIDVGENNVSGIIDLPYPPVFQLWPEVVLKNFILNQGSRKIKINMLSSGIKLKYFAFEMVNALSTLSPITTNSNTFHLLPNPTNGLLKLLFPADVDVNKRQLKIYNLSKQVVFTLSGSQLSSSPQQIDVSCLPAGLYL